MLDFRYLDVRVLEQEHEGDANYKGVGREDVPCCRPWHSLTDGCIYNQACSEGTDGGAKTVGHEHEDTLCAGTDAGVSFLLYIQ